MEDLLVAADVGHLLDDLCQAVDLAAGVVPGELVALALGQVVQPHEKSVGSVGGLLHGAAPGILVIDVAERAAAIDNRVGRLFVGIKQHPFLAGKDLQGIGAFILRGDRHILAVHDVPFLLGGPVGSPHPVVAGSGPDAQVLHGGAVVVGHLHGDLDKRLVFWQVVRLHHIEGGGSDGHLPGGHYGSVPGIS